MGTTSCDPLQHKHIQPHTLTVGVQQAIGQSRVVSVTPTQLAGGGWDAHISTNTRLQLWSWGSCARLKEGISQRGQCRTGVQASAPNVVQDHLARVALFVDMGQRGYCSDFVCRAL